MSKKRSSKRFSLRINHDATHLRCRVDRAESTGWWWLTLINNHDLSEICVDGPFVTHDEAIKEANLVAYAAREAWVWDWRRKELR